jgi:tetratricopeptide (TPR) repeat protein
LFNPAVTFIGSILLTIAVYLTVKAIRQNNWLTVMGFAWFILFIIPPMFFKLFYSKYLLEYYEHRSYLPLMGLVIVVAILLDQYRKKHNFPIIVSATILVIFTFLASAHSDNFKDSIAFFSNATDRGNPGACTKRGEMYFGQRDFTNAISDFNTAIDLSNGEYAPALFNKGLYESQVAKNHPAAENDYTRAIATDNTFIDAYIQRASERVFSNNFDGAINDLDIAKRLDSTRADIYYTKAKVFTSALKFKEALPYYNKSIAMNEYSAEMYNDRAYVKYRIKDFLGALKDCNKAISLMPNFMSAYYNKGVIYLETGKAALAVKEFDTTLALTNNFYFGYFYRGMAKKQLHDMKGACADWQESIQLGITREAPMVMDTINKYCK